MVFEHTLYSQHREKPVCGEPSVIAVRTITDGLLTIGDSHILNSPQLQIATASRKEQPSGIEPEKMVKSARSEHCIRCGERRCTEACGTNMQAVVCRDCYFKSVDCGSCGEYTFLDAYVTAPCGDTYCADCLIRIFEVAVDNYTKFPPRCCGRALSIHDTVGFLPSAIISRYVRLAELKARLALTQCATPSCGRNEILAAMVDDDWALCTTCVKLTCALCGYLKADHESDVSKRVCPVPELDESVHALAQAKGWQRCSSCHNFVSRVGGCNSILCLCDQRFCYKCGQVSESEELSCTCSEPDTDNEGSSSSDEEMVD